MITFPDPTETKTEEVITIGAVTPPLEETKPLDDSKIEKPLTVSLRESLKRRLKGEPDEEKKEEAKAEEKVVEAKTEEVKPVVEEEKKAAPKKKKPSAESEALKLAGQATETARAAVELAQSRQPEPYKPKTLAPELPTIDLPEAIQEDIPILQKMEEKFPDRYKGITKKFIAAANKSEEYQRRWEQANPGQPFDPQAEDHNDFFAKNEVTWSDRDYGRALAAIETDAALGTEREATRKKLEVLEAKERARTLEPAIRQAQSTLAKQLVSELGDDYKNLIGDDGRVNAEEEKRLKEEDPYRYSIVMNLAGSVARFTGEVERLFEGLTPFNDKNPVHNDIYHFSMDQERQLKDLPAEQQRDEQGRNFATRADYSRMTKAQQERFWTLEKQDLQFLWKERSSKIAKNLIAEEEAKLSRYLAKKGYTAQKTGEKEKPATTTAAAPAKEKPNSPSAATNGKIETPATTTTAPAGDSRSKLKSYLRGSRV